MHFSIHFSYALAYTSEDTYCPHDTGETWYYWDSYDYDWDDADAGLRLRCVSSPGPGKSIQSWLILLSKKDLTHILFTGNALTCNNNADCPSNLICDGNLKTCRKHARDQSYHSNFCGSNGRLCQEMEGDCDHDKECEGSLECGSDNCNQFDYPPGADCCSVPGNIMKYEI